MAKQTVVALKTFQVERHTLPEGAAIGIVDIESGEFTRAKDCPECIEFGHVQARYGHLIGPAPSAKHKTAKGGPASPSE